MKHLLPQTNWYKANLHTHTTVSDGKLTPEETRDAYKARGYSILALTDHSVMVAHQELNQPDFLLLTGVEIDVEERENPVNLRDRKLHLCLLGKDPLRQWVPFRDPAPIPCSVPYEATNEIGSLPRRYDPESINAVIAECNRQGFLVTYNHPCWSLENYEDYAPLEGLWAMEYRNSESLAGGFDENNGRVYQDMCVLGKRLMPVCADDTHNPVARNGYAVLGDSWNMIGADRLDYATVMAALERGDLYASCGPELTALTLEGDTLTVACSEAVRIHLISHSRFAALVQDAEKGLTGASFSLARWRRLYGSDPNAFIRIIVTDSRGRYAVTRAYFADEL